MEFLLQDMVQDGRENEIRILTLRLWVQTPKNGLLLLLLLLLSCFSRVRLCATPEMAAYQALLSLEFSRQEYRSRLDIEQP